MAKKTSDLAVSKSDSAKSNRRKKCDSSNLLPDAVDIQTNLTDTSSEIILYQPDNNISRYPVYVVYHTDYSSGRKDLLKRDMLYTNDEQQAREMLAAEIADNVKKGWEEV